MCSWLCVLRLSLSVYCSGPIRGRSTMGISHMGRATTLASYLIVASITGVIVGLVSASMQGTKMRFSLRVAATGSGSFGLLTLMAILLGPAGVTIPETRVRGIFFAEWKFLTFIFYIGLPVSFLATGLARVSDSRPFRWGADAITTSNQPRRGGR